MKKEDNLRIVSDYNREGPHRDIYAYLDSVGSIGVRLVDKRTSYIRNTGGDVDALAELERLMIDANSKGKDILVDGVLYVTDGMNDD